MAGAFVFAGGVDGAWAVRSMATPKGEALAAVSHIGISQGVDAASSSAWSLKGVLSNARYATRQEVSALRQAQPDLGRPLATRAALIPIRKSPAWWDMAQDERREIFEETSRHTRIGMDYLPAIARRLHHCRDLGEPFDFLTWFEFMPEDEPQFDSLLKRLRATREWDFVDREIDIRLERVG